MAQSWLNISVKALHNFNQELHNSHIE